VELQLFAGFCFALLPPACSAEPGNDAKLKSLFDSRRWFELRDLIENGPATAEVDDTPRVDNPGSNCCQQVVVLTLRTPRWVKHSA
jgi:hypothetical protein